MVGEGFVGNEAAIKFHEYVETYSKQVSVEDVLAGRRGDIIKAWSVNECDSMLEKIADSHLVKDNAKLNDDELLNLGKFIHTIPCELAMKAWKRLTMANDPAVIALWDKGVDESGDKTFGRYIAEVSGNDLGVA